MRFGLCISMVSPSLLRSDAQASFQVVSGTRYSIIGRGEVRAAVCAVAGCIVQLLFTELQRQQVALWGAQGTCGFDGALTGLFTITVGLFFLGRSKAEVGIEDPTLVEVMDEIARDLASVRDGLMQRQFGGMAGRRGGACLRHEGLGGIDTGADRGLQKVEVTALGEVLLQPGQPGQLLFGGNQRATIAALSGCMAKLVHLLFKQGLAGG